MAKLEDHSHSSIEAPLDISDITKLNRFRKKRAEWFELFSSEKTSIVSIQRQLFDAIIEDLNYRVFAGESARHKKGEGYAIPSLLYLLNIGYVISQSLAARRLLDTRSDVSSLYRVLKDIRKNRNLITRENFVSYDGTIYDPDVQKAVNNDDKLKLEQTIFGLYAPSLASHLRSHNRHTRFDSLSCTCATARDRKDLIHPNVFDILECWLQSPEAVRLKKISDNRFAHASDGSNAHFKEKDNHLALIEVESAQKGFVRVSRAIFDVLLNSEIHSEVVPMIPLGSFGTVWQESDLVSSTFRMQEDWDRLVKERNSWGHGVEDALYSASFNQANKHGGHQ